MSVLAASAVAFTLREHWIKHLVSFSVGAMLAAALLNLLPEAVEAGLTVEEVGRVVLVGLMLFFLIEKCALWRHQHTSAVGASDIKPAGLMVLIGDAFHNFVDGVLLAAAFLHDVRLGIATALAIIAHEIPQEVGDFMVLLNSGFSRRRALTLNVLCSLASLVGGLLGYYVLQQMNTVVPYAMALAAASFIYIAVADLIPELHNGHGIRSAPHQIVLMGVGAGVIIVGHGMH